MAKESEFQKRFIKKVENLFPDCVILKNDSSYKQGIPDLSIFYKSKYAFIECKKSEKEHRQPNQEHYINKFNQNAFGSFVYPENEREVLQMLKLYFEEE